MSLSQAAMGTLAAQRRCVDPPIRRKRSAYVAKRQQAVGQLPQVPCRQSRPLACAL